VRLNIWKNKLAGLGILFLNGQAKSEEQDFAMLIPKNALG